MELIFVSSFIFCVIWSQQYLLSANGTVKQPWISAYFLHRHGRTSSRQCLCQLKPWEKYKIYALWRWI